MPVTEKTMSTPGRRVEDVASVVSGDQLAPDQRLPAPPFQKAPVVRAPVLLTTLVSIVTAPFIAKALPRVISAPAARLMLVKATIFPSKMVLMPTVAELPTCQNILGSEPLAPSNVTAELGAVARLEPIWNMKVPLGSFLVSRKSVPVNWAVLSKRQTPGESIMPPKFVPDK